MLNRGAENRIPIFSKQALLSTKSSPRLHLNISTFFHLPYPFMSDSLLESRGKETNINMQVIKLAYLSFLTSRFLYPTSNEVYNVQGYG